MLHFAPSPSRAKATLEVGGDAATEFSLVCTFERASMDLDPELVKVVHGSRNIKTAPKIKDAA